MVSGFTLAPKYRRLLCTKISSEHAPQSEIVMGNLLRSPDTFLVYCSVRDYNAFYVIGFENIRIQPSTRYRIRCGFIFCHSGEQIYFFWIHCRIRRIYVDGSRIWKEKLRIRKYPDTCGRGLYEPSFVSKCSWIVLFQNVMNLFQTISIYFFRYLIIEDEA